MPPDLITVAELKARLGPEEGEIERLWTLAEEATYSDHEHGTTDYSHWIRLIRSQLTDGRA
jgi:hypothetical protein